MTWTLTKEESTAGELAREPGVSDAKPIPRKLHVRAIIDIDNEQAEIKELIASLQKHVKEET